MDFEKLSEEFLRNNRLLHKARPHKNINDAFQGEAFILHFIAENGDNVLPGEISNVMDVSSARVATALNSLENKGLVTRQIDKEDRRRILVSLTQKGKDVANEHRQIVIKATAKMLGLLGEHDAKEYVRITERLAEIVSSFKEPL